MKHRLTSCFLLKAVAFILAVFSLLGSIAGTLAIIGLADNGYMYATRWQLENDIYPDMLYSKAYNIAYHAVMDQEGAAQYYHTSNSNLQFEVCIGDVVIETTRRRETYSHHITNNYSLLGLVGAYDYADPYMQEYLMSLASVREWIAASGYIPVEPDTTKISYPDVTVELWLLNDLAANDEFAMADRLLDIGLVLRDNALPILAALYLLALVTVIYLFCGAGHRWGREGISLYAIDRIPMDIYTAGCGLAIALLLAFTFNFCGASLLYTVLSGLAVIGATALTLAWVLGFAARAKAGALFQNTLIWRILRLCWRVLRAVGRGIGWAMCRLPLVWKSVLVMIALCAVNLFGLMATTYDDDVLVWWFLCCAFTGLAGLVIALNLKQLQTAIRRMAGGDLVTPVDTHRLFGDFRRTGQELGHIREGMTAAVDRQMKSERLKTELITNVSHDIKTPLTSIINYVDLLKKEQPESETMQEYIDVLDRQSTRLKKLIEDLIEASKASSGAIATHTEPCDLGVLLNQVTGEFSEKLAAAQLTPVVSLPDTSIIVQADGRHLWRVFDNLMNNICKYAMPGTRVYLSLAAGAGIAAVTLRNISREELNITADELTERFVRGDRSRHTEGSGLGLSIARSLIQLQGGTLDIAVDGDLFKVTVTLPAGES